MITRIIIWISALHPKSNETKDSANQERPKTRQRLDATSQEKDITSTHKVMHVEWSAVWRIQKYGEIYSCI